MYMMRVDAACETEEILEYDDYDEVNMIMRAEDEPKNFEQRSTSTFERWPMDMTMEECMLQAKSIMRNEECEDWERDEAIKVLSDRVKKLNDQTNHYASKRQEMIQIMSARTRSAKKQEESFEQSGNSDQSLITNESPSQNQTYTESVDDFSSYNEYAKEHKADLAKKRVHFDSKVIVEPEAPNVQTHANHDVKPKRKLRTQRTQDASTAFNSSESTNVESSTTSSETERVEQKTERNGSGLTSAKVSEIDTIDDFSLANFLMENKVKL
jgi:hypothetical protein